VKQQIRYLAAGLLALVLASGTIALAQNGKSGPADVKGMVLAEAAMCEHAGESGTCTKAVVFSIALGQVSCLTVFDQVEDKTFVFHSWYRQDVLTTKKRLAVRPPRWAAASTMELREADKGPWRVEVSDASGRILAVLRFSVVD